MSKFEHDSAAANLRENISCFKPWYKSCSDLLIKNGIYKKKCLDLCCGNVEFSLILKEKHGMSVTCADYIPSHLNHAKQEGFQVISIDIDDASDKVDILASTYAQQFDIVVNLAAIEHIFNSDNLLRFTHSVLKPGGLLLVNTPNIDFLAYRLYAIFSGNRPFGEGHHIRFWNYQFLRTNLFLNGFNVLDDYRRFYALPQDAMRRAFKNWRLTADAVAWMFHFCKIFQYVPLMRGLCSDELTVLAVRDEVPALGFNPDRVESFLEKNKGTAIGAAAAVRLIEAKKRGWLKEHINLTAISEKYSKIIKI
jgi:SAM-dependent methyltransferase